MPVIIPSVLATEKILRGSGIAELIPELQLLIAFLLLIAAIMILTFKFVLEE
jgi:hypothetical protein